MTPLAAWPGQAPRLQSAASAEAETQQGRIDFIVIGVQKGGTSSLDALLRRHPRLQPPHWLLRQQRVGDEPATVFVSMREPYVAIERLAHHVLPQLSRPIVLVSGSYDATLPRQIDRRWRPYDAAERRLIDAVADSPLVSHWFAENLDEAWHPKVQPLPLGMLFADESSDHWVQVPRVPLQSERPLTVLCSHRVRAGPQWELRAEVSRIARSHWQGWAEVVGHELSEAEFDERLARHGFVLCVEGGGLDPSPKAWRALLHGAIPIVRESPLAPAYRQLPVAVVPRWEPSAIDLDRLTAWREAFAPWFDTPAGRARLLERLGMAYWWRRIGDAASGRGACPPTCRAWNASA